jgi:hypothetical protein
MSLFEMGCTMITSKIMPFATRVAAGVDIVVMGFFEYC